MRIGYPHMGQTYLAMNSLFRSLDIPVVMAAPTSRRTLSLGTRYSPETICLPFKLTLGNMIEALESGADTIVMAAGRGLCRFGYYAKVQEQVLKDQGYEFNMVTTDLFGGKIVGVTRLIRRLSGGAPMTRVVPYMRLGLSKVWAADDLERVVQHVRAREQEKGGATRLFKEALAALDETQDLLTISRIKEDYSHKLRALPQDSGADPLKVGIVGEFYVVLEPFSNMDVEVELGKLGVEVHRSLFLSSWTKFSLFLNTFGLTEKARFHKAAMPYLSRDVGGDGWETVGEKVCHAQDLDGLVHLAPFTCMPEIVAQNILPTVKADIPMLTIICDEQMGKAGMVTRLEAFVDLLHRRRRKSREKVRLSFAR